MHIRPILSAMLRNKTGAALVALQVAVTLAVVINATFIVGQRLAHVNRPSGMDIENIVTLQSLGFRDDYQHEATVKADLDLLRSMPGVLAAAPTIQLPLSGSGSASGFRKVPDPESESTTANTYWMDHAALDALGVELAEGRGFRPEEITYTPDGEYTAYPNKLIVTKAFADKMFGEDEEKLGKLVYNNVGEGAEIVGVIEHMHGAWVSWDELNQVIIYPSIQAGPVVTYVVRVSPGMVNEMMPRIEDALSATNPDRMIRRVRSMSEVVERSYSYDRGIAVILSTGIVLLITVTAAGIVGLASFSVRQRTKQIGTRRAIGARRGDILSYFMTENWLMMTIGVTLGVALTLAINHYLAQAFSLKRIDMILLPIGVGAMWALGLLAVLGPARRASRISPAIATRTV